MSVLIATTVVPADLDTGLDYVILRPAPELTEHDLQRAMGLAGKRPVRPGVARQMERMAARQLQRAQPRLVLGIGRAGLVDGLLPGFATLQRYLQTAEHAALMAGTAGVPDLTADEAADPLMVFVANAVAVALVRKLFRWAREYLKGRWHAAEAGEPLTPGNCGVPLHLQRTLLERLPLAELGIRYDATRDLLWPLASVSGLIGVGAYERLDGSECLRCPSADCPLRETDFDRNRFQELTWYCAKPKLEV